MPSPVSPQLGWGQGFQFARRRDGFCRGLSGVIPKAGCPSVLVLPYTGDEYRIHPFPSPCKSRLTTANSLPSQPIRAASLLSAGGRPPRRVPFGRQTPHRHAVLASNNFCTVQLFTPLHMEMSRKTSLNSHQRASQNPNRDGWGFGSEGDNPSSPSAAGRETH